jgi:signal transduction histidine kinase
VRGERPPQEPAHGGIALRRALRTERTLIRVRWVAVVFALVQVLTYYIPHPPGAMPAALGIVALLALGNVVLALRIRGADTLPAVRRLGAAALALDTVVVLGLVVVYTFDPDTAMWAVLYLLPLEAAMRFQLRGALLTMAVMTVGYVTREVYGSVVYGNGFWWTSISFRMGIGFLIAWVAGWMASSLVRDRSELEEAKGELERSTQDLALANAELAAANEIKDDFLAMTNHELRTPLTTILGYTTMLRRRWSSLPETRKEEFIVKIEEQGERLQRMVEGLLMLSSAQAGALNLELGPVHVRTAVDEAIMQHGVDAGLFANRCPEGVLALADRVRLGQILVNYLTNARKYGGPPIVVTATEGDEHVDIVVADQGSGVPEEFVPHLFDKFSQASIGDSRTAQGTGLGLAIVERLAEAQGGRAWYEPNQPHGSRFVVRLMAAERAGDEPLSSSCHGADEHGG